jgi:DNA-binding response OmpR family regulator
MPKPVLIVEDDPDIAESLRYNLEREGFTAQVMSSGEKGLEAALDKQNPPQLVLLDLMLPGMSGTDVCRRLRREPETRRLPIIMLMARVRAVLRRVDETAGSRYEDACLTIDFDNMLVSCGADPLKLTRKEFALLKALAKSAGRVASRQRLLDEVWGYNYYGDERTLDVHVRRLRHKLGKCAGCLETVVGVGYRFVGCSAPAARSVPAESAGSVLI